MKRAVPRHFFSLWCGFFIWKSLMKNKSRTVERFLTVRFVFSYIFKRYDMSKITRRKPYSKCLKIYSGIEFKVWSSLVGTEKPPGLVHVGASQARTGCSWHLIRIRTNSSPEVLTVYHIFTSLSRGLKIFYFRAVRKYNVDVEIRSSRCGITYM